MDYRRLILDYSIKVAYIFSRWKLMLGKITVRNIFSYWLSSFCVGSFVQKCWGFMTVRHDFDLMILAYIFCMKIVDYLMVECLPEYAEIFSTNILY